MYVLQFKLYVDRMTIQIWWIRCKNGCFFAVGTLLVIHTKIFISYTFLILHQVGGSWFLQIDNVIIDFRWELYLYV